MKIIALHGLLAGAIAVLAGAAPALSENTNTQDGAFDMTETRRIVTGTKDGKSVFTRDEVIAPTTVALVPGGAFTRVFGTSNLALPNDGSEADIAGYYPDAGGATVTIVTLPPDPKSPPPADFDMTPLLSEAMEKLPGLLEVMEPDGSMMHTTPTVDFVTILSGRLIIELDDGATRELNAGDVLVQNGTRHAWRNPFDEPVVMHAVSIGVAPGT